MTFSNDDLINDIMHFLGFLKVLLLTSDLTLDKFISLELGLVRKLHSLCIPMLYCYTVHIQ